jgi:hypothetical protein
MIIDAFSVFDQNTALTATAPSTNVLDLTRFGDIGVGCPLRLAVNVTTTFLSAGLTTLKIQAQSSVDNATFTTLAESPTYVKADLVAGTQLFPIDWPALSSMDDTPRYLRLNYVVTTGPFTAGNIYSMLVLNRQNFEPVRYRKNFTP